MRPGVETGSELPPGLWVVLLYPPAALAAVLLGMPWLKSVILPVLVLAVAWRLLKGGHFLAWLLLAAAGIFAALALVWPVLAGLPPAFVVLALAACFWWSLRPGSVPLIRRFARFVHESHGQTMPENSDGWLKAWTAIWAMALTTLGAGAAFLAVLGSELAALLWPFLVFPAILGMLLGVEYFLRLRRFPDYPHLSWTGFLRTLGGIRWHHIVS